jgi:hypothetical protein
MYFIVSIIIKHNNTLNDDSKKNRIKRCGELNIYKNLCVIDTAQHMSTFGSSLKFSLAVILMCVVNCRKETFILLVPDSIFCMVFCK